MLAPALVLAMTGTAREPPSEIIVRPQSGMGAVRLGDSSALVTERMGSPVRRSPDLDPGPISYVHWFYPGLRLSIVSSGRRGAVLALRTTSPTARTIHGLPIGATVTELRRAHPGARCHVHRQRRNCTIGEDGGRQTDFEIRKGRVRAMQIADVF